MVRILSIGIILLIWGCANRVSPTGGPKDEDPPELVRSVPENGQRNFKSQEIELEFNEFIAPKSLNEQLIITPRIDTDYEYKYRKRSISLEFEEPFADSTTYTLNFRDGIVDLTESLPTENLQIAFSTGNLLDTLEIYGSVLNLMTQQPKDNLIVGLYSIEDTLDIFTGPPYYFAKTDAEGHYHFRNIKDGTYKIYAFEDGNKNLICQSDGEAYGFLSEPIELDTVVFADTINIEHMNLDTLELTRVRSSGRYFNVLANKYLTMAKLTASNDSSLIYHYNDDRKGLIVYNSFPIEDSLLVFSTLRDSLEQISIDSFYLKFPETTRPANEFKVTSEGIHGSFETGKIKGIIKLTKPINQIRLDSIFINRDTTSIYPLLNNFTYTIDSLSNTLEFEIKTPDQIIDTLTLYQELSKKDKSVKLPGYNLNFGLGGFMSVEQDTSALISQPIKFIEANKTGIITGDILTQQNSFFIQLLNNKFQVVKEQKDGNKYRFSEIPPGDYFIRILIDSNENGLWDYSDIRYNRMAEPLILYRDDSGNNKTVVRANWEINVDLNF